VSRDRERVRLRINTSLDVKRLGFRGGY
jgi:hypothetical protein